MQIDFNLQLNNLSLCSIVYKLLILFKIKITRNEKERYCYLRILNLTLEKNKLPFDSGTSE